jgi:3-dehydro-L-gulonate 2-dehydrogenase
MSQYSYGMLDLYKLKGEKLPVAGGFDSSGNLTTDPDAIIQSQRVLPIGYWKGAGFSLLLDILAAILSGGLSTSEISKGSAESRLSQVFVALDLKRLSNFPSIESTIQKIIEDYHQSVSTEPDKSVRYPGERVKEIREENLAKGIPVVRKVWDEIHCL